MRTSIKEKQKCITEVPFPSEIWKNRLITSGMWITSCKSFNYFFFFFQAEDGIRDTSVTGVQTCALPISGDYDQRRSLLLVLHRRIVDRNRLVAGFARCPATLGPGRQLVAQADVGEGAAHHHLVIPAPRPVRIEVYGLDAVLDQPLAGGTRCRNRSRGRDVVRCNRIAEHSQRASVGDATNSRRRERHSLEEWWILHVGRIRIPRVEVSLLLRQAPPVVVAVKHVRVLRLEHFRLHRLQDLILDFFWVRPDVAQENGSAFTDAERLGVEIDVHAAGESVSNDERWRSEEHTSELQSPM